MLVLIFLVVVDASSSGIIARTVRYITSPVIWGLASFKLKLLDLYTYMFEGKERTLRSRVDNEFEIFKVERGKVLVIDRGNNIKVGQLVLAFRKTPIGIVSKKDGNVVIVNTIWSSDLRMPVKVGEDDVALLVGGIPPIVEFYDDVSEMEEEEVQVIDYPTLPNASATIGKLGVKVARKRYLLIPYVQLDELKMISLFPRVK